METGKAISVVHCADTLADLIAPLSAADRRTIYELIECLVVEPESRTDALSGIQEIASEDPVEIVKVPIKKSRRKR